MAQDFAADKASYILDFGDPVTILRAGGNIPTTARLMSFKQSSSSKTVIFSTNYMRLGMFLVNCGVQRGDLIVNTVTGEQFFVIGFQEKMMQGIVNVINAVLYIANYPSVTIQRLTEGYDNNLNPTGQTWTTVGTVPMNVEHIVGNTQYKDGLLLPDAVFKLTMQTTVSLQLEDRVVIDGKNYQVSDINLSMIQGLQIVQVKVDMR